MPPSTLRLHVDRNSVSTLVRKCIDCPDLATCDLGSLENHKPASGNVPDRCKLPRISKKEAERIS